MAAAEISTYVGSTETSKPNGFGVTPSFREDEHVFNVIAGVKPLDTGSGGRAVQIEELYPIAEGRGQLLSTARALLASGYARLSRAQEHLAEGDHVAADYEASLFQGDLPELFCCSTISEGLSALTVATHHALKNRGPSPLSVEQLNNMKYCIGRMTNEIFLSYNVVLDLLDDLENSGLDINPREAETLGELLNESTD